MKFESQLVWLFHTAKQKEGKKRRKIEHTPTVINRLCCRDSSHSSMGPTWPLNVDASQLRSKICIQPYESQMII